MLIREAAGVLFFHILRALLGILAKINSCNRNDEVDGNNHNLKHAMGRDRETSDGKWVSEQI